MRCMAFWCQVSRYVAGVLPTHYFRSAIMRGASQALQKARRQAQSSVHLRGHPQACSWAGFAEFVKAARREPSHSETRPSFLREARVPKSLSFRPSGAGPT
jgi:hypothetical protein